MFNVIQGRSRRRLKRLRFEPRICLGENQNKEKEPFLKIGSTRNIFL